MIKGFVNLFSVLNIILLFQLTLQLFGRLFPLYLFFFLLLGTKRIVENGHSINFWLDTWYNDFSLSLQFPLVYAKSKTATVFVSDVWNGGHINFYLTRGVSLAMCHEKL
jgi:hypothetical protein